MLDRAPELSPVSSLGPPDGPEPARAAEVRRPTLPVERAGAFIEVLLCSGFPTQLLTFTALTGLGLQPRLADGAWSPSFVIAMSLIDMVLVIGLVYLFLRAHREPVRAFLVGRRRPAGEALLGVVLIPAAFMLVVVVLAVILAVRPELHNVAVNPFEQMLKTPRDAAIFAVVAMLAGGLREEVQRAFIVRRFDQFLGGGVLGVIVYSAVFGLGHLDQGYAAALATAVLGAAWGFLYLIRRSVIAPIVSHAGFNLTQLLKYVALAA